MEYLKPVVMELNNSGNRKLAWDLIDIYFNHARSLIDYDVLGYLSLKTDKYKTYLECAEAAYSIAETTDQKYLSRVNLSKAYNIMNMPEKALFYIDQNLQINPENFEMLCEKSFSMGLLGKKEEAEKIIDFLFEKFPEKKEKLIPISGKLIRSGKLAKGIKSFVESFKPENQMFEKELKMKRWDTIIRPGATIYVDGEGGIGDEIINIRFFDILKNYGMKPILYSPKSNNHLDLNNIFRRHNYEVINDQYSINPKMQWVPFMSLPGELNLTEKDLWKGAYLKPLRNPKNELPKNKFKIGIKCSGNPYFLHDEFRKIPLELMLKYLPNNADIYYIDKEINHPGTIDLGNKIESWEDTLDFIDQMDCIVSSCTSLVHAAGAMGKTTFVAVPINEYYIWNSIRDDGSSAWYGNNFYVSKQTEIRNWDKPLADIGIRVKDYLKNVKT